MYIPFEKIALKCTFRVLIMKSSVNDSCANGYHFALVNIIKVSDGGLRPPLLSSILLLMRNDTLCALVVQITIFILRTRKVHFAHQN